MRTQRRLQRSSLERCRTTIARLIVGQTSFGKGLVQSIIPLEFGAGLTLTSAKYFTPSGRLIQRDYSNGGFYDYYTHGGGVARDPKAAPAKPAGPETKTDTGRAVYGGGGISPDENVNPRTVNLTQRRLLSPVFAFTRELVNGRIRGLEASRIPGGINFRHELKPEEFKVTDAMFKAFRDFATADPGFKVTAGDDRSISRFHRTRVALQPGHCCLWTGDWRSSIHHHRTILRLPKPSTFCQKPATSPWAQIRAELNKRRIRLRSTLRQIRVPVSGVTQSLASKTSPVLRLAA